MVASFVPVPCSQITPTSVSWLWEPYLARGKLSVIDGDPGTGKSFVTIDLAARISSGAALPCGGPSAEPASVLLLSAEDDARDTICPRLLAANSNPSQVGIFAAPGLEMDRLPQFPQDLDALESAIRISNAALVVIDPLMAFLPSAVYANNDQSIRSALSPLAAVAAASGACILLVRHLRKSGGANAIYRGSGSIGIMGAVRTGLMIARHPEEPELRVMTICKTNIGPPGHSLGYRLVRNETTGQTAIEWAGRLDITADDLFGAGVPVRAISRTRERAVEWLRGFLSNGKRRAKEVEEAAVAVGIPLRTLERVKTTAGVESRAVRKKGVTEWWWYDAERERQKELEAMREAMGDLPELESLRGFDD
jgi:AAA domain-containing protein